MDWRVVALGPLFMWALYAVFGSLSSNTNGPKVTMAVEAMAMVAVAVVALGAAGWNDFKKATALSIAFAVAMGLMSALGVLAQLYAFQLAPQNRQGVVVMLGGMFPVLAVVIFHAMHKFGIQGGSPATPRHWLGVLSGALALWLVSGK